MHARLLLASTSEVYGGQYITARFNGLFIFDCNDWEALGKTLVFAKDFSFSAIVEFHSPN